MTNSTEPADQRLLWSIIEASPNGMLLVDHTGRITMANRQVEQIVGYSRAELINRPLGDLLPERFRAAHQHHAHKFHGARQARQLGHGRYLVAQHKDGREVPVEIGLAPVRHDEVDYVLASLIDITERERVERALHDTETYHQTILENIGDAVFVTDQDGRYLDVNSRACELTGYSRAELLRLSVADTYALEERDEALRRVRAVRAGTVAVFERRLRRKDGSLRTVESMARLLPDGRLFATLRDVTERAQLEQQLRQAQKMEAVGRLAGGVAHDFNNILSAIFGYCTLLAEQVPAEAQPDLEEIRRAAERAAGLTRQLLAFSRQQVLEPVVLNLNALIEEFEKMLRRVIGEDVELRLGLSPTIGNVRADPGQLHQVIMNLVVNARDAMPTGGKLLLETTAVDLDEHYAQLHPPVAPGRYVMLAVTDTGTGMPPEVKARIFEPFFTTKEKGKGTGLGLSTVYGIVKQSGGYIWAYSEPGRGTTFKVYLPQVEEPITAPVTKLEPSRSCAGTETILIAEDDPVLRPLAQQVLGRLGYRVLTGEDVAAALQAARTHDGPIHLLIADVVMPGASGRDLARRLLEERPALRVLFVSGYPDDAIVRHGMLEPGLNFLQKPFTPAALARKVRDLLDG